MQTKNKKDHCGSLLTPLFRYLRINLHLYTVNHKIEYVYTAYLIACHILRDETTYKFTDKEGNVLYCKLPRTSARSRTFAFFLIRSSSALIHERRLQMLTWTMWKTSHPTTPPPMI